MILQTSLNYPTIQKNNESSMFFLRKAIFYLLITALSLTPNVTANTNKDKEDQRSIIILLGPTGSGKGTQSIILSKEYTLPHISTGDLYREEVKSESALATLIKHHEKISKEFIPQEMMIGMLMKRLLKEDCKKGFILDGFPRSLSRSEILRKYIIHPEDKVYLFVLNVKDPMVLKDRLSKRYLCPNCHKQHKCDKMNNNKCDKCGNSLVKRDDDTEEKFLIKLKMYNEQIKKITGYLEGGANIKYIDITKETTPETVHKNINEFMKVASTK